MDGKSGNGKEILEMARETSEEENQGLRAGMGETDKQSHTMESFVQRQK